MANNPLSHVRFYNPKIDKDRAYAISDKKLSNLFTPRAFSERLAYIYVRDDAHYDVIEQAYRSWRAQLAKAHGPITPFPNANPASPRKNRARSRLGPGDGANG